MLNYRYYITILAFLFSLYFIYAQEVLNTNVRIELVDDTLHLQNKNVYFKYLWNKGNIVLKEIQDKRNAKKLFFETNDEASFYLPNEAIEPTEASVDISDKRAFPNEYLHKEVIIYFKLNGLEVKHRIKIYPNNSAISHTYFLKGYANASNWIPSQDSDLLMIENNQKKNKSNSAFIGNIPFDGLHWKTKIVSFKEATDYNDNLVFEKEIVPYRKKAYAIGNVLLAQNIQNSIGFFLIKEAPIENSQQYYPGYDFQIDKNQITVHGLGISPEDIDDKWIQGYGYAVGISISDTTNLHLDLLSYQKSLRRFIPERDGMILANTWGDRSKDSRMNENFILNEIENASQIGITHLQLDDGWQKGLSRNSASKSGEKWDDWTVEDWQPHLERFPNGLEPIIKAAKSKGVEICLWFNPSKAESYALWERDADILIDYYETYGIKVFKIDGMSFANKKSEINLRNLFTKVMSQTNGNVTFNMDVTAGNRVGYHYFNEFGNIFLENRYTDWANYYPHKTLRNLWQLSAYVPAERLQIEFLNNARNKNKYLPEDLLAPSKMPITYTSAITLMAQPLAWMELSNLENKSDLKKQFEAYKSISNDLHKCIVLPMGFEPSGFSWTGFVAYNKNEPKYIFIYKEASKSNDFKINIDGLKSELKLKKLFGDKIKVNQTKDNHNFVSFKSKLPFSYAIFLAGYQ